MCLERAAQKRATKESLNNNNNFKRKGRSKGRSTDTLTNRLDGICIYLNWAENEVNNLVLRKPPFFFSFNRLNADSNVFIVVINQNKSPNEKKSS